jgi:hypothetical protein
MILGFNKHAWGNHNLFIKFGGGALGFIGQNLRRTKGMIYILFYFIFASFTCFSF